MEKSENRKQLIALLGFIILCLLVEIVGGWWFTQHSLDWYEQLRKPFLIVPNFLFAPVWTVLYILMAISIWLVWKTPADKIIKFMAYIFFSTQLFLNFIWSPIFFGHHNIFYALITIILLDIVLLATILSFYLINRKAAYLLIPYFVWVLYATYLNLMIWLLNV